MKYTVEELAESIGGQLLNSNDCVVNHVSTDSRSVQNSTSTVFFALIISAPLTQSEPKP